MLSPPPPPPAAVINQYSQNQQNLIQNKVQVHNHKVNLAQQEAGSHDQGVVVNTHHHFSHGGAPVTTDLDFHANANRDSKVIHHGSDVLLNGKTVPVAWTESSAQPAFHSTESSSTTTTTSATTTSTAFGATPTSGPTKFTGQYVIPRGTTVNVSQFQQSLSGEFGVASSDIFVWVNTEGDNEIIEVVIKEPAGVPTSTVTTIAKGLTANLSIPIDGGGYIYSYQEVVSSNIISYSGSNVVTTYTINGTSVSGTFSAPEGTEVDSKTLIYSLAQQMDIASTDITTSSDDYGSSIYVTVTVPHGKPAVEIVDVLVNTVDVPTVNGGPIAIESSAAQAGVACGWIDKGCYNENPQVTSNSNKAKRVVPIVLGDTTHQHAYHAVVNSSAYNAANGGSVQACQAAALAQGYNIIAMQAGTTCFACVGCAYAKYGAVQGTCPTLGGPAVDHVYVLDASSPACPGSITNGIASTHVNGAFTVALNTEIDEKVFISSLSAQLDVPTSDIVVTTYNENIYEIVDVRVDVNGMTGGGGIGNTQNALEDLVSLPTDHGGSVTIIQSSVTTNVVMPGGTALDFKPAAPETVTGQYKLPGGSSLSISTLTEIISEEVGVSSSDVTVWVSSDNGKQDEDLVQVIITVPPGTPSSSISTSLSLIDSFPSRSGTIIYTVVNPIINIDQGSNAQLAVNYTVPSGTRIDKNELIISLAGQTGLDSTDLTVTTTTAPGGTEFVHVYADLPSSAPNGLIAISLANETALPVVNGGIVTVGENTVIYLSHIVTVTYAVAVGNVIAPSTFMTQLSQSTGLPAASINVTQLSSAVVIVTITVSGDYNVTEISIVLDNVSVLPTMNGDGTARVVNQPEVVIVVVYPAPPPHTHQHGGKGSGGGSVETSAFSSSTTSSEIVVSSTTDAGQYNQQYYWCSICTNAPNWTVPPTPNHVNLMQVPPCPAGNICPSISSTGRVLSTVPRSVGGATMYLSSSPCSSPCMTGQPAPAGSFTL